MAKQKMLAQLTPVGPQPAAGQLPSGMQAAKGIETDAEKMKWRGKLAAASPGAQNQMLGQKLFPQVMRLGGKRAVWAESQKVVGMLLELDNSKILDMLEEDKKLWDAIKEAHEIIDRKQQEIQAIAREQEQAEAAAISQAWLASLPPEAPSSS